VRRDQRGKLQATCGLSVIQAAAVQQCLRDPTGGHLMRPFAIKVLALLLLAGNLPSKSLTLQ
jgi:hypothetical protein